MYVPQNINKLQKFTIGHYCHLKYKHIYRFDFIKGFKYLWNDALTASLFKGLFLAAAKIFS